MLLNSLLGKEPKGTETKANERAKKGEFIKPSLNLINMAIKPVK
jgi:hypothetical protein